jgi:hypothetical protein
MRRGVRRFAVLLCCVAVLGLLGVGGSGPAGAFPTGVIDMLVTQRIGGADCQLGLIDLVTGTVTPLPHVGGDVCMSDIAYAPDGRLFGLATNAGQPPGPIHLFQLDTTTGQVDADLGQFGSFNAFADPTEAGLAFDSSGTVFATMVGTDAGCGTSATCLYRANLSNIAAAQFVGAAPTGTSLENLAISCSDAGFTIEPAPGTMNAKTKSATPPGGVRSEDAGPNALLNALNLTNGAPSTIGTGFGTNNLLSGLDFDGTGTLWGVGTTADTVRHVFTLDTTTGTATVGPILAGATGDPVSLALQTCSTPPPPPPLVIAPRFTG